MQEILKITGATTKAHRDITVEKIIIDTGMLSDDPSMGDVSKRIPSYATILNKDRKLYIQIKRVYALPLYVWSILWWMFGTGLLMIWLASREWIYALLLYTMLKHNQV